MSDGRPAANDQDRLPWLEPYREPTRSRARHATPAPPARRSSKGGLIGLAAVVGLGGALAGGYWIGQRQVQPSPQTAAPPTSQPVARPAPQPVPPPTATPPAPVALAEQDAVPAATAPPPRTAAASRVTSAQRQRQRSATRARIRSAGVESAAIDKVREEQGEPVPPRVWPRQPSPGPSGQVIQLGAFRHPDTAYAAYRRRIARYPTLGAMPRVIVPVIARDKTGMLYVLRLGTTSRRQSTIICRNLRRSGDPCVVIG